MRFKEIISERGRNSSSEDDPFAPAPGSVAAAQADAADIEKRQKAGQFWSDLGNRVIGRAPTPPAELKDAPPGFSIDPIQRANKGYKPATQKEIADFQAANPNYGKVVGGDGKPIKTGDGSDLVSGGGAAMVQTAQAAAPQTKGDAKAGQGGYNYQPPTPISTTADAKSSIRPAADAGQPEALGMTDAQIAAAQAAKPAAAPDDSAARAAAAAAAGQTPIRDTGQGNTPLNTPAEIARLAGVPPKAPESNPEAELDPTIMKARADQEAAARAGQAAQPPAFDPRVYGGEKAGLQGTTPEIIRPNAMAQPGEAPVADVDVYKRSEMDDFGREGNRKAAPAQASTPAAKTVAPKISPAIVGYASRMGLYKNGQPDPVAIKAFQEKNGLKADGIIGANTSGAILSAAKPGAGKQGGAPAPADRPAAAAPAQRGANTKAPAPVTPGRTPAPALTNRTPPTTVKPAPAGGGQVIGGGRIPQGPARAGVPPVAQAVKESQDIQRMRFLAGLSKE
jgi:hypothetical protein